MLEVGQAVPWLGSDATSFASAAALPADDGWSCRPAQAAWRRVPARAAM